MGFKKNTEDLVKAVKRMFEKPEDLGFKKAYKFAEKRFIEIEDNYDDQNDRLEPFKHLHKLVSDIFEEHDFDIQAAVEKPTKARDGWRANLTPWVALGGAFAIINCTDGTSLPFMASFYPLYIAGACVASALTAAAIGVHALRRHRGREHGLSVSDVKYAIKLDHFQKKVMRHINKIEHYDESKKRINNLITAFSKSAANNNAETTPAAVATATAAADQQPEQTVQQQVRDNAETITAPKAAAKKAAPKKAAPKKAAQKTASNTNARTGTGTKTTSKAAAPKTPQRTAAVVLCPWG